MTLKLPDAETVQERMQDAFSGTKLPQMIAENFGAYLKIRQDIRDFDEKHVAAGGTLMEIGGTATETGRNFTDIHIKQFRDRAVVNPETGEVSEVKGTPPSIPSVAMAYAEKIGIEPGSKEYTAMLAVAVRAEKTMENEPDYHNRLHFLDVAVMTANNIDANDRLVAEGAKGTPLSREDKALAFIAAIGHDIGHPGGKNPAGKHYELENQSIAIITPLLQEAGLSREAIEKIDVTIKTTSPDGPNKFKDAMLDAVRAGKDPHAVFDLPVDPKEPKGTTYGQKFPELKVLADNPRLLEATAMVGDADLYASGGAGFLANHDMSVALTSEWDKAGVRKDDGTKFDHGTDGARNFFLGAGVVGGSFGSEGGRENGNDVLKTMVDETQRRMQVDAETTRLRQSLEDKNPAPGKADGSSQEPPASKFMDPAPDTKRMRPEADTKTDLSADARVAAMKMEEGPAPDTVRAPPPRPETPTMNDLGASARMARDTTPIRPQETKFVKGFTHAPVYEAPRPSEKPVMLRTEKPKAPGAGGFETKVAKTSAFMGGAAGKPALPKLNAPKAAEGPAAPPPARQAARDPAQDVIPARLAPFRPRV